MARPAQAPTWRSGRRRPGRTTSTRRLTGYYRDDAKRLPRRQLQPVLRATQEGDDYFSGKLRGNWRGSIGHTWEARIKLDCLYHRPLAVVLDSKRGSCP